MKVLWVCNIMLPAIAQALSQEYSVREGWLSGILGRYLEAEDAAALPITTDAHRTDNDAMVPRTAAVGQQLDADSVNSAAVTSETAAIGRQTNAAALTLGIAFPVAPGSEELSKRLQLGSHKKEVACYGFAEDLEHPEHYDSAMEARFSQILADFQPDLVHIFGTEFPHGYACAKVFHRPDRTLVGLQGLCISCADNYMADIPEKVQNSRTLRDILKKDSIRQQQEKFYQRAENEKKLLLSVGHVTGRTTFDKTISLGINPSLSYHKMYETMRPQFYSGCWEMEKAVPGEIFISQGDYPLKGFHYLLQAMQEILQSCPEAHIKVAGISVLGVNGIKSRIKIPAYGKYLRRLLRQNHLEGKVRVLGKLSADEMKREYLSSQVFVCPSAVENSPNSVAEGQLLGVPVAASRTGGIPNVVEDGVSGLLFEKGNVQELAACVSRILTDKELAKELSASERKAAEKIYCGKDNYDRLMEIYQSIV